ncbi:MAG: TRAP transporter small permease subunit [Planctomycetota bacterium]|jgi:TRAP-type C4-dicarboxylate transport system permease small subunit|nr:TRAP transporter small permease subunit [Planctomycetota bacterium]
MSVAKIAKYVETAVLTLLGLSITVVMLVNVVLRYCFASSLVWAEEFVRIGFVWAMFIAIVASFMRNEHIGFESLMRRTRLTSRIRDLLYGLSLVSIGGLMAWFGWIYNGFTGSAALAATNLPTSVLLLPGIAAGAAWCVIGAVEIHRAIRRPATGKE